MIELKKVEKRGEKWCVIHCTGPKAGKPIKCFDSKEKAEAMHRAIQASKHKSIGPLDLINLHGRGFGQGQGGPRQGDGADVCVCPKCGHKIKHEKGKPCNEIKCPKCGTIMRGK